jgi:acylpyruvate hydrolase
VIAHGEEIVLPDPEFETFADPEAELGVVIGRTASRVAEADAYSCVAGYTIVNDVSGRDTQNAEKQWLRAKSFDTFAPMGPWIVTRDEIVDPHALDITCRINGEVRQKSNTSNLVFTVPFLVSYLSQTMVLRPGDVIATGTPGGVGIFREPKVRLEAGDVVQVEIAGIGMLENRVAASRE